MKKVGEWSSVTQGEAEEKAASVSKMGDDRIDF